MGGKEAIVWLSESIAFQVSQSKNSTKGRDGRSSGTNSHWWHPTGAVIRYVLPVVRHAMRPTVSLALCGHIIISHPQLASWQFGEGDRCFTLMWIYERPMSSSGSFMRTL